jgi:Xaa-Pro aminopeptidase
MDRLGDAVVLIAASGSRDLETEYLQDNDFRQNNYFFYFSQLESPGAWIVMSARAAGPDSALLLLPDRNPRQERWTGAKLGPGEDAARLTGFPLVLSSTKLDSVLAAVRSRGVPVYTVLGRGAREVPAVRALRAESATVRLRDLRPVADSMRLIKDSADLYALRRAVQLSAEAHRELIRRARAGMFEYELEAIIEYEFRRRGADRLGYPSIVGSGYNGTTLHYDVNRRQTGPGDLVVVDAGAEWGYHTADITRTFPVGGRFAPRQRAIYDLVLATQQAAMDSVRPGITMRRLGEIARDYMRQHSGNLCDTVTCDAYFIHGLGHWLGMDVHDVGDYSTPLAPGMVFTIEPGIYIPGESLGVRIEDVVQVTPTGYELLSGAAPRRAEEIESLMQESAAPTQPPRPAGRRRGR